MMPSDTLTCDVTPNSVDPTSLSCSMPPLEWLELWTTIGGVATSVFTLVLAVFAIAAWRSSRHQLEIARKAEKTTFDGMQAQILAANEENRKSIQNAQQLAEASLRTNALAEYVSAFYAVMAASHTTEDIARDATNRLSTAGLVWRLSYDRSMADKVFTKFERCLGLAALMNVYDMDAIRYSAQKKRQNRILALDYGFRFALTELQRFHRGEISETSLGIRIRKVTQEILEKTPDLAETMGGSVKAKA